MKRPGLIRSSSSYYRSVYAGIAAVRDLLGQGKLTIPVLSIAGQASFGDVQRRFVDGFAANVAGQAVIDDAGHFVAEEQPEALMKEMHAFLAG